MPYYDFFCKLPINIWLYMDWFWNPIADLFFMEPVGL